MLFENITPLKRITVAADKAQALLDSKPLPGTAITVTGKAVKPLRFKSSGKPTAPIWLIGAEIALPTVVSGQSAISTWGFSNIAIIRARITGGFRGVLCGEGSVILIADSIINGCAEDGIKVTHAIDTQVIRNTILGVRQEAIDHVGVHRGEIAYNEVSAKSTAAAIFAKMGSDLITIHHNYIHDVPNGDGISLGGQGASAEAITFGCARSLVSLNKIERVGQNPIITKGAIDSILADNFCSAAPTYSSNISIATGYHDQKMPDGSVKRTTLYSRNVEVVRNWLLGKTSVPITRGCSAHVHDNLLAPTTPWVVPVGPPAIPAIQV